MKQRILKLVQADTVEPDGDHGFLISSFLFGGILSQIGNKHHRFITGTVVSAPQAVALGDAIKQIEPTQTLQIAMAINGDPTGEGVAMFCAWLRGGAFEIVDGQGRRPSRKCVTPRTF